MALLARKFRVSLPGFRDKEVFERMLPPEMRPYAHFSDDMQFLMMPDFVDGTRAAFKEFPAETLVMRLAAVAHTYGANAELDWTFEGVSELWEPGTGPNTRTITIRVVEPLDDATLESLHAHAGGEQSKLERILQFAKSNKEVSRALNLMARYPNWREIYYILTFVRGRGVKLDGFASAASRQPITTGIWARTNFRCRIVRPAKVKRENMR